jgi:hypothetical protein
MNARHPPVTVRRFVETLSAEIGAQTFAILSQSGLPREWSARFPSSRSPTAIPRKPMPACTNDKIRAF